MPKEKEYVYYVVFEVRGPGKAQLGSFQAIVDEEIRDVKDVEAIRDFLEEQYKSRIRKEDTVIIINWKFLRSQTVGEPDSLARRPLRIMKKNGR